MTKTEIKSLSKFLSLILRHRPELAGLQLDSAGWVEVDQLLRGCRQAGRPLTAQNLDLVVQTNDKNRFEFSPDKSRIRACQGHSVPVDLEYEPLPPPEILYQGTATRFLSGIREHGLLKMQRHHVHLSEDIDTAMAVGQRHGKVVVLEIQSGEMHRHGYNFYRSTNQVWLTDTVPPQFIVFPDDHSSIEEPDSSNVS